jgi:hypothetical protein
VTALTQEVKLQGRAFKQMSETLVRETERRSRKEVLDALLEMRERLLRGLEAVRTRDRLQPGLLDRIFAPVGKRSGALWMWLKLWNKASNSLCSLWMICCASFWSRQSNARESFSIPGA